MNNLPKIKVFGIGGAGCHLIDKMLKKQYTSVDYYVVDDDYGALQISKCKNKIQLVGSNHSGADYAYSERTALANKSLLVGAVKDADMVILIAGMGGGMGSAVTPVIADIAKENNILTVAAVCTPFSFEGEKRLANTEKGLCALKEKADMTIVVPCEKAKSCLPESTPISEAMKLADTMIIEALNTIIAPMVSPAAINLEYEDIAAVLRKSNNTFFGLGIGEGKERIIEAVRYAMNCPMAETTIDNVTGIILYVEGGDDLTEDELTEIATCVRAVTNDLVNILFAANIDSALTGKLKVSIIAAKNYEAGDIT